MSKVLAISMVKNEADIIESFVRHTLTFVDEMLIAEHSSTDRTPEILEKLQAEGLPLTVRRLYVPDYVQVETMNALLKEASIDKEADIVMPLDADEFLLPAEKGESLHTIVRCLNPNRLYQLLWRVYEPLHPHEDEDKFLLSRPLRRGTELAPGQKVIIGGAFYRSRPFQLSEGSHYCAWKEDAGERRVPWTTARELCLAHFLWRSNEQYIAKIRTLRLNSVAKYSLHTPTALLMPRYQKIASGQGEGCTFEGPSEIIDLTGIVEPQALLYSINVRPEPEQRVFEVGVQIAAARAEERVLSRRRVVTTVIPYNGDDDALRASLKTLYDQIYPYQEVFVLSLVEPAEAASSIVEEWNDLPPTGNVGIMQREKITATLLSPADGNVFEQISQRASGDYVQWIFPGEVLAPDKLMKMVASLELADYPFALIITNGYEIYENRLPWGNFPADREFLMAERNELWKYCLQQGKYPAVGMAGAVFHRRLMEPRKWLESGFLDGRPLFLTMWRMLLTVLREDAELTQAAVIQKSYSVSPRKNINAADWIWHQIEWYCLLGEDKTLIGDEAYRRSLGWFKQNAAVAEHFNDVPEALLEQYQEILAGIGE